MHLIKHIYINGRFVTPVGNEWLDIIKPADGSVIGRARLADARDAERAIAAAHAAFPAFAQARIVFLPEKMH